MTREEVISVLNRMQEQNRAKELPLTEEEWVAVFSATRHLNNDLSEPQGLDEAAEEYAHKEAYGGDENGEATLRIGFKAGVKWIAEQGITCEGVD